MLRSLMFMAAATLTACAVTPSTTEPQGTQPVETNPPTSAPSSALSVTGKVLVHEADGDVVLENATACGRDAVTLHCARSDASGEFTLEPIAADSILNVMVSEPGYVSSSTDLTMPEHSIYLELDTLSTDSARELATASHRSYDPGVSTGAIFRTYAAVYDGLVPLEGVSIDVNGEPAVYELNGAGDALRATTSRGWAAALGFADSRLDVAVHFDSDASVSCGLWRNGQIEVDHFSFEPQQGIVQSAMILCAAGHWTIST